MAEAAEGAEEVENPIVVRQSIRLRLFWRANPNQLLPLFLGDVRQQA